MMFETGFAFTFARWAYLCGWLGGALAWHLSAMWILSIDGGAYLIYGFVTGHFRRDLALRDDIQLELAKLRRRGLLWGALSLGALSLLTSRDFSTHSRVDAASLPGAEILSRRRQRMTLRTRLDGCARPQR